jgi:hypothetical protein
MVVPLMASAAPTVDRIPRALRPVRSEVTHVRQAMIRAAATRTQTRAILRQCAQTAAVYTRLREQRTGRP